MSTHAVAKSHKGRFGERAETGGGGEATSLAPIQVIRTVFENVSGRVSDVPTEKKKKLKGVLWPWIQNSHARVCTDENERFD